MRHDKLSNSDAVTNSTTHLQRRSHELCESSTYNDPFNMRHDKLNKSSKLNELNDTSRGIQ